jgi:hypothetical protein
MKNPLLYAIKNKNANVVIITIIAASSPRWSFAESGVFVASMSPIPLHFIWTNNSSLCMENTLHNMWRERNAVK